MRSKQLFAALIAFAVLHIAASSARAQVTVIESEDGRPTVYKMTVSPAAEPRPALKYHFLVPPVDKIKGNAATFYYKSMVIEGPDIIEQIGGAEKLNDWLATPLDRMSDLPTSTKEFESSTLEALQAAAKCDTCDWGDNIRERGVTTLLPQAQKMRLLGNVLALRTRYQLAEGKFEDAIETLRLGYSLSRNFAFGCCLVQDLIGIAIQGWILDDQTRALIACENSPNLYWALNDLAATPVDLRRALSFESKLWNFTVHELADLDRRVLSPEEAFHLARVISDCTSSSSQDRPALFLWAVKLEPEASKYLLANGFSAEKLEPMPVLQIVLLCRWKQFEIVRDDCFKWLTLPDTEIRNEFERADRVVKIASQNATGKPFIDLLPAIFASQYARMRSERQTNALRIVEALRMHAAEHGKWPQTLDEVKVVPIPRDPYSGKSFEYALKDGVATLSSPPDVENQYSAGAGAVRYELTLRRETKKTISQEK